MNAVRRCLAPGVAGGVAAYCKIVGVSRDEMILRHGWYVGIASRLLGDTTYIDRWLGRAHELTEADCLREGAEIHARLVAAEFIDPDEDPFEL